MDRQFVRQNGTMQSDKERITLKSKEQLSKLKEELRTTEETVTSLTGDKRNSDKQVKSLKSEVDCLQLQKDQIETKNRQVVTKLKYDLKQSKAEVQELKESFEKLRSESSNAKLKFEADIATLNSENCHKTEVKKLGDHLAGAKNQIRILEAELKLSSEKVELITGENHTLQNEKQQIIAKNRDEVSKLNEQITEAQANIAALHQNHKIGELEATIKGLEEKVKEANEKLEGKTTEVGKQEARVQHLLKQLLRRETDNHKLQWKIDANEKALAHQKNNDEKIAQLTEKNRDLEKSVHKCKSESVQHQNDVERLSNEKAELARKLGLQLTANQDLKVQEVITISSDDDDEDDAGPSPAKKSRRSVN